MNVKFLRFFSSLSSHELSGGGLGAPPGSGMLVRLFPQLGFRVPGFSSWTLRSLFSPANAGVLGPISLMLLTAGWGPRFQSLGRSLPGQAHFSAPPTSNPGVYNRDPGDCAVCHKLPDPHPDARAESMFYSQQGEFGAVGERAASPQGACLCFYKSPLLPAIKEQQESKAG